MPQRLSNEMFIDKARVKHGDTYGYGLVEYKNGRIPVVIICPVHGEFLQTPNSHLVGRGCKECGRARTAKCRRKTSEQFIVEAREVHGDTYGYDKVEYVNVDTSVIIVCSEHGDFPQSPYSHLRGSGCPTCGNILRSESQRKTTEQFISESRVVHGDFYGYEKVEYVGSFVPVIIACPEHGDFSQEPHSHLTGRGCQKCGRARVERAQRKTTEQFTSEAQDIHGNLYGYGKVEYVGCSVPVIITCPEHGDFLQTPSSHLSGHGCQKCGQVRIGIARRKTLDQFITEAREVYGDFYGYDKVEYVNTDTSVLISCPEHGDFQQTPYNHLKGRGCKMCACVRAADATKKTTEQFIAAARNVHGDTYKYHKTHYVDARTPLTITCLKHGDFVQIPYNHLNGKGCQRCGNILRSKSQRKTTEQFVSDAKKVHGNTYGYDNVKYFNNHLPVIITCSVHGDFQLSPQKHLNGRGCQICGIKKRNEWRRKNTEQFIVAARDVHGDFYGYDNVEYVNIDSLVLISCPEHGNFEQTPYNHLKGQGCKKCGWDRMADKSRKTTEQFIAMAKEVHGDAYGYNKVEYISNKVPVTLVCPKHGDFFQLPSNHVRGVGCQTCRSSYGERAVADFLDSQNIMYERQKSFSTCRDRGKLFFDFYVTHNGQSMCIEFHGAQHYKPVDYAGKGDEWAQENLLNIQRRDAIKKQWARRNNIPLFVIPFWEQENVETFFTRELMD